MRRLPASAGHSAARRLEGETEAVELDFAVDRVEVVEHAAAPTLEFALRVDAGGTDVRSLSLNARIRILAPSRTYDEATGGRLEELFGHRDDWARNLRNLLWLERSVVVPTFSGTTVVPLRVPCTYDFEVSASKYLDAVREGEIPLELLFSGSLFYTGPDGALQTVRLPWDLEARFDLPARVWHGLMDRYFPNTAWLRVRRDAFDRLNAFRGRQIPPTWEAALEKLLEREQT